MIEMNTQQEQETIWLVCIGGPLDGCEVRLQPPRGSWRFVMPPGGEYLRFGLQRPELPQTAAEFLIWSAMPLEQAKMRILATCYGPAL